LKSITINLEEREKELESQNEEKQPKTRWHYWFGVLIKMMLSAVGLDVKTDHPVMNELPEADVIIINKDKKRWTNEQLKRLPDGVNDSKAAHILLELKYSESLSEDSYCQTCGYYKYYKDSSKLNRNDVDIFIISSKTPSKKFLEAFGYIQTNHAGVYKSHSLLVRIVTLISLNDLAKTPNNIMFKLFASKKREQNAVSKKIKNMIKAKTLPTGLDEYFYNFINILSRKGKNEMDWLKLSPKEKQEMMRSIEDMVLDRISTERRLKGLRPEDRLKGLRPEDRLKGLRPEDRLEGLRPEDRLKGLDINIIEAYLNSLKKKRY